MQTLRWLVLSVVISFGSTGGTQAAIVGPMGDQLVGNCGETDHGPGCSVPACEQCVCALNSDCCDVEWTQSCLLTAGESCPAACYAVVGDCGVPRNVPGCSDPACESCVCGLSPLGAMCCTEDWDITCAQYAVGILFGETRCEQACLTANRRQPAPTLSVAGLLAGLCMLCGVGWYAVRRRS